ncbi:MAG: hypothetical protein E7517_09430 [Ruminococcaceae bacterium]|nr:hypothetical protein [Oscillospiraceae bacterium]
MKITTFNPMILSKNADEIIEVFGELGFKPRHQVDNIDNKNISSVCLKDANGLSLDVAQVESMAKDMTTIRMNVSDFDEAYELLKERGFKNIRDDEHTVESESARSCLMIAPTGFSIQLTQHLKD